MNGVSNRGRPVMGRVPDPLKPQGTSGDLEHGVPGPVIVRFGTSPWDDVARKGWDNSVVLRSHNTLRDEPPPRACLVVLIHELSLDQFMPCSPEALWEVCSQTAHPSRSRQSVLMKARRSLSLSVQRSVLRKFAVK